MQGAARYFRCSSCGLYADETLVLWRELVAAGACPKCHAAAPEHQAVAEFVAPAAVAVAAPARSSRGGAGWVLPVLTGIVVTCMLAAFVPGLAILPTLVLVTLYAFLDRDS